jgi:hypothetical protein
MTLKKSPKLLVFGLYIWSWRTGSNRRPADYKSAALPAELRQQKIAIKTNITLQKIMFNVIIPLFTMGSGTV